MAALTNTLDIRICQSQQCPFIGVVGNESLTSLDQSPNDMPKPWGACAVKIGSVALGSSLAMLTICAFPAMTYLYYSLARGVL